MAKLMACKGVKFFLAVGQWLDRVRSKLRFDEMLDKLEVESSCCMANKLLASVALRGDMISLPLPYPVLLLLSIGIEINCESCSSMSVVTGTKRRGWSE